jgi:hypothetical protein
LDTHDIYLQDGQLIPKDLLTKHLKPFQVLHQTFAVSSRAEQLRLRWPPQRIVAGTSIPKKILPQSAFYRIVALDLWVQVTYSSPHNDQGQDITRAPEPGSEVWRHRAGGMAISSIHFLLTVSEYCADYNNRPSNSISSMSAVAITSGSLHCELDRILFLKAHRETASKLGNFRS